MTTLDLSRCSEIDWAANFPDGQYAHRRLRLSITHNHAEDRAQALDTMSAVIAMARRNDVTVEEAAELGAASMGIQGVRWHNTLTVRVIRTQPQHSKAASVLRPMLREAFAPHSRPERLHSAGRSPSAFA